MSDQCEECGKRSGYCVDCSTCHDCLEEYQTNTTKQIEHLESKNKALEVAARDLNEAYQNLLAEMRDAGLVE